MDRRLTERELIEKRRSRRVAFFATVSLAEFPDGARIPGQSVDINSGGIRVVTRAAFEPGQIVTVSFFLKNAAQEEVIDQVKGKVVYLQAGNDANYVGVEFLQPFHEAKRRKLRRTVEKL